MTIGAIAKRLGVTTQTVRGWADEYDEFMSEGAVPEKGQTREFVDDDLRVLALVASMRADGESFDSIRLALSNGRRGTMILPMVPAEEEGGDAPGGAMITRLATTAARYEGELKRIEEERARLAADLEKEREARIQAERAAAAAEAFRVPTVATEPRGLMLWRWALLAIMAIVVVLLVWQGMAP